MSIKINKGGDLGKYFYSKDDVIYGPIKLDELLQRVDENTLVFYNGIDWTKASELPELKKFIQSKQATLLIFPPVIDETSYHNQASVILKISTELADNQLTFVSNHINYKYNNHRERLALFN